MKAHSKSLQFDSLQNQSPNPPIATSPSPSTSSPISIQKKSIAKITLLQIILGLLSSMAIVPAAIAQTPAELIPPAPDTYATGTTFNPALPDNSQPQPNGLQNPATFSAQMVPGYRVFIPSDNPTLFAQAKAIEPTAFIQTIEGQRVIQVGLFGTEAIAMQQVARFQAQGMPVRLQSANQAVNTVPAAAPNPLPVTVPPAPGFSPTLTSPNPGAVPFRTPIVNTRSPGYYVIVPTNTNDANYVLSQLNQLGIPPQYIFLRDRPFGLHYAIGTFSQRSEAERLSGIVRDRSKFDARVYHER